MNEPDSTLEQSGWQASLSMSFKQRHDKTVITDLRHKGPLRIQRPFYPEGATSHVYLLHPPGGVVGGDSININLKAESGSHALLTTPGATKFYRSTGVHALLSQTLNLEADSNLEWFPQENILFPGACVKSKTRINVAKDARLIAWEINCLGRPVNQEIFSSGKLDARIEIFSDNKPLLLEKQRVFSLSDLNAASGLRNYPMQSLMVSNHVNEELLERCREKVNELNPEFPVGLTLLDDFLVLRALSTRTEKLHRLMVSIWQLIRPEVMGKTAELPRIWAT